MSRQAWWFRLAAISFALGYAVLNNGGSNPADWNISLLVLGGISTASISSDADPQSPVQRKALWAGILFPAYVAFQLIPLPLFLLQLSSPTRAEVTHALGSISDLARFAPLSIGPPITIVHLSRIVAYTLLFLLIRKLAMRCTNNIWLPAVPLIIVGGLQAAWGLGQHLGGATAIAGTSADRDLFAGLLEMTLPFTLLVGVAIFFRRNERGTSAGAATIKAGVLWSISAGILTAIVFSFSKMGLISALGSLFVVAALWIGREFTGWKRLSVLAALGALVALAVVFLPPNELIEQMAIAGSDPTAEGRLPIWKDTLHLIAAYPLFGCGLGNYNPGLLRYETSGLSVGWAWAHNDYLQLLAELGITGFLIPATLMLAAFVLASRAALCGLTRDIRLLGLACTGALAAMFIHSFTQFNMYYPANAMALSWITGIATSLPSASERRQPKISSPFFVNQFVFGLGVLASLYAGAWLTFLLIVPSHPKAERVFCRFGICDTDGAVASLQDASRAAGISAIPSAEFLVFLHRDPAGPARWCDLGESFQKTAQTNAARYCFSRALVLGPHLPYILFRAAMFDLSLGQKRQALEKMASALGGDPGYDQTVFDQYQHKQIAVEEILRYGLPDRRTHQAYLRFLMTEKKPIDAERVWEQIVPRHYADDKLANEYAEFLIQNGKPEAAAQAWASHAGGRSKGYPETNRVFNGDFESEPTGSRFDWTVEQPPGAKIDFDGETVRSGARSLRIQFDGTQNLSAFSVRQTVFLKPGRYRFQAYVRTRAISTDEGIAFRLASEQTPNRLSFTTESMAGTTDWKLVRHVFQAPPGTGLVEIRLIRTPSLRFDNLIRGTLWIDQVSISPEPGGA